MNTGGEAAVHDARSLSLPDWRSAVKRRIRRPRRPPSTGELLMVVGTIAWTFGALGEAVNGRYVSAGASAFVAGCYWRAYQLIRVRGEHDLLAGVYALAALAMGFVAVTQW